MSSLDYYSILEIERGVNQEEISNAFKRLATKYNPHVNLSNQQANQQRYDLICEAFEVLSNEKRKAIFDTYGEFGLKNGIIDHNGTRTETYVFLGNSDEIANKFFGVTHFNKNAFEYSGQDLHASFLADGHKGLNQPTKLAPADVKVTLQCTLAEFYNGSCKTVNFKRT